MNLAQLQRGKEIEKELKELDSIVEYFGRYNPKEGTSKNPIEHIVNYLTGCQNISGTTEKEKLAAVFIQTALERYSKREEELTKEFDNL